MKNILMFLFLTIFTTCLPFKEKLGGAIISRTIKIVPTLGVDTMQQVAFTLDPINLTVNGVVENTRDTIYLRDSITGTSSTVYLETIDTNCIDKIKYQVKLQRGLDSTSIDTFYVDVPVTKYILDKTTKDKLIKSQANTSWYKRAFWIVIGIIVLFILLLITLFKLTNYNYGKK